MGRAAGYLCVYKAATPPTATVHAQGSADVTQVSTPPDLSSTLSPVLTSSKLSSPPLLLLLQVPELRQCDISLLHECMVGELKIVELAT